MEQRGVLVAIAGRRDGVRVYALEEIKKAIDWRMDMEIRRERDRSRRETVKKIGVKGFDSASDPRQSSDTRKASLSTPPPGTSLTRNTLLRKASYGSYPIPSTPPSILPSFQPQLPLIARSPTSRRPKSAQPQSTYQMQEPFGHPPPYTSPFHTTNPSPPQRQISAVSVSHNSHDGSNSDVLTLAPHSPEITANLKTDWNDSSDDEAIDIVAAGSSGSQALDERTSALFAPNSTPVPVTPSDIVPHQTSTSSARRNRPSNLDLALVRSNTVTQSEPSPVPTLLTLRRALSHSPPSARNTYTQEVTHDPDTPIGILDEDEDDVDGGISLAQALLESRIPELPPLGTRQSQQPILLRTSHDGTEPSSPRTSEGHLIIHAPSADRPEPRRRRWSVLLGGKSSDLAQSHPSSATPSTAPPFMDHSLPRVTRSRSFRSIHSHTSTIRPSSSSNDPLLLMPSNLDSSEPTPSIISSRSSRSSRFIPRLISNAFMSRRPDDRLTVPVSDSRDVDGAKRTSSGTFTPHAPPPKLEYVKLPGTKGALMVKAVETVKKRSVYSFNVLEL